MSLRLALSVALASLCALLVPRPAAACGGLFCDSSNPVNQAAERIVFADNGDGSVTALIEIQYEGPSESFAWVLPVPGVPTVEVSSTAALDRIQSLTNPIYRLNRIFEDCDTDFGQGTSAPGSTRGGADAPTDGEGGVSVLAEATVGPFDYQVISVDDTLPEPGDAAVQWLMDNGYDLMDIGPERLGPYLEDGLNLIAFKLNKQNDAGSIRPIVISYEAEQAFIPIRPTAVAATADMGILVWVLGGQRAIPDNYKHLELNEALIDWFNANNNYNDVVTAAADEAGGQGFVTEMASDTSVFDQQIVFEWERGLWSEISSQPFASGFELLEVLTGELGQWDGFEDAVGAAATLPDTLDLQDLLGCISCYREEPGLELDPQALLREVWERVVKPMFDTQELFDSAAYFTRFYTTMSADEMTVDPSFDFNPDLPDVDNVHVADQYLGCDSDAWRVELPQGGVIHGEEPGQWPVSIEDQPANLKILQLGTSGQGDMVEDNSGRISDLLAAIGPQDSRSVPGGSASSSDGGVDSFEDVDRNACGCRAPGAQGRPLASLSLLALACVLALRRRRR